MRMTKKFSLGFVLLFCSGMAYSQEVITDISVNFRVNNAVIDTSFSNNNQSIEKIKDLLEYIEENPTIKLKQVVFCGSASPDGSDRVNRSLAQRRLQALERSIRNSISIPDSIIDRNDSYIPWNVIEEQVAASDMPYKQEVLAILKKEANIVPSKAGYKVDSRILELQQLDGGKVWKYLLNNYFSAMRQAYAILVTDKPLPENPSEPAPVVEEVVEVIPEPVVEPDPEPVMVAPEPAIELVPAITWMPHLSVKTNAIGWALGITNVAVEVDFAKHWSVALPFYYSGWNYFKTKLKFRTLGIQPEVRYWISEQNDRFFVGTHFGLASYNLALGGKYRYQDKDSDTPAIGGGVSVGYRMPISKDNRWKLEFSLGAGSYVLQYDKFYNTNPSKDGKLVTSVKKVYTGIDQAAISFSYTFDLKK